jgi:uncharacterized membrane protein YesL
MTNKTGAVTPPTFITNWREIMKVINIIGGVSALGGIILTAGAVGFIETTNGFGIAIGFALALMGIISTAVGVSILQRDYH